MALFQSQEGAKFHRTLENKCLLRVNYFSKATPPPHSSFLLQVGHFALLFLEKVADLPSLLTRVAVLHADRESTLGGGGSKRRKVR